MEVTKRVKVFVALATLVDNLNKVNLITLKELKIPEKILDRIQLPLTQQMVTAVKTEMCKFSDGLSESDDLANRMFYKHKDIDLETRDRMWAIFVSYKYLEKYKRELGSLWSEVVKREIPELMESVFYKDE